MTYQPAPELRVARFVRLVLGFFAAAALMGIGAGTAGAAGTADLVVKAHAKREIRLTPCSLVACAGSALQFRVVVRNRGPDPATNVVVRLSGLDDRDTPLSVDCSAGGSNTPGGPEPPGVDGCAFARVAPREQVAVAFHFTICCPFGQPGETITHGATITAQTADPDPAGNAASSVTRVVVRVPRPGRDHLAAVRVVVLDFDPIMDDGVPLTRSQGWNAPEAVTSQYDAGVGTASAGLVRHRIVRWSTVRSYPAKPGGFVFTNPQFLSCLSLGDARPDVCSALIDYQAVLNTAYDPSFPSACEALARGLADEVFLWGGPWFGYQEYLIVEPGTLCAGVDRPFAVMGFNYERGVGEALHDLGHRAEAQVHAGIGPLWDRFDGQSQRYAQDFECPPEPDAGHPDVNAAFTGAGNVHFPPNAYCHYQYDRDLVVQSEADDWANFPYVTGRLTPVGAATWGGTQEGFLIWWLGRFPRGPGTSAGIANDWWRYIYPPR